MRGFVFAVTLAAGCLGVTNVAFSRGAPAPDVTGNGFSGGYYSGASAGGCLSCANVWDGFCEEKERWCNRCHHGRRCNPGCATCGSSGCSNGGCGCNGGSSYGESTHGEAGVIDEAPMAAPEAAPSPVAPPAAPTEVPAKAASYSVPNLLNLIPSDWQQ